MILEAAASPRVSRVTRVNEVSKSRRVRLPSKYSIDARPSGPVRTVSPSRSDMPSSPDAKAPLPRWTATCPSRRRSVANCLAEAVPPEKIRTAPTNSSASTKTAVIEISRPRFVVSDSAQAPPADGPILVAPPPNGKHVGRISSSLGATRDQPPSAKVRGVGLCTWGYPPNSALRRSSASISSSRSPSMTRSTSPISTLVRWSFTSRYGAST